MSLVDGLGGTVFGAAALGNRQGIFNNLMAQQQTGSINTLIISGSTGTTVTAISDQSVRDVRRKTIREELQVEIDDWLPDL